MEAIVKATSKLELNEKQKTKCLICLKDVDAKKMFKIARCHHRFCSSCMKKHVKLKVRGSSVPRCPQLDCGLELDIATCRKFIPHAMYDLVDNIFKESSIPTKEKAYCPNPKCSKLMSKTEALAANNGTSTSTEELTKGRCVKCQTVFCVNCKVVWHSNKSCAIYKKYELLDFESADAKLKVLARKKRWSQCPSCSHMVELDHGCYHMFCRCGHQFCYLCGKEWKNKKTTCSSSCPLWSEVNLIHRA